MKYLSFHLDYSFLNRLSLIIFLASGSFILLLWSPNVLGRYVSSPAKMIIYTLPWIMLWVTNNLGVINNRKYSYEIILMILIIILGAINVIYSENPDRSYLTMKDLILTGVIATWTSLFIINSQERRDIFSWFCLLLIIIATAEIIIYFIRGLSITGLDIFTLHRIPVGTLMILLSIGPMHLILSASSKGRMLGYLTAIPGGVLILMTLKRGTFLAVAAIGLFWISYRFARMRYLLASIVLVILILLPIKGADLFKLLNPEIPRHSSIIHRAELYPFALHVWEQHPFLGIGLRALTHENYLKTYKQWNENISNFANTVRGLQTFDNMYVTSFVELGTIMTFLYFTLIILIMVKYCLKLYALRHFPMEDMYRLSIIIGFIIHSMTYHSLLFPPVNWLFHVNLGIMAAYARGRCPDQ